MNIVGLRLFFFISLYCLSLGLSSCTSNSPPTDTHPENVYEGGFGGDGGHVHEK